MIREYIDTALSKAKYEIIEDEEPYYGEVRELPGVWATGKTLEECRQNLADTIDDWLLFRLNQRMDIPPLGSLTLKIPSELEASA
jgi:predicted RNase H-like HicB family nuclease